MISKAYLYVVLHLVFSTALKIIRIWTTKYNSNYRSVGINSEIQVKQEVSCNNIRYRY